VFPLHRRELVGTQRAGKIHSRLMQFLGDGLVTGMPHDGKHGIIKIEMHSLTSFAKLIIQFMCIVDN